VRTDWIVTIVVIAVTFGVLWYTGQLVRLRTYVAETRVEMQKCAWPTWNELKGSTIVVSISILILGAFTFLADQVFRMLVLWVT
jgi:preprotein translocase SecE subunit